MVSVNPGMPAVDHLANAALCLSGSGGCVNGAGVSPYSPAWFIAGVRMPTLGVLLAPPGKGTLPPAPPSSAPSGPNNPSQATVTLTGLLVSILPGHGSAPSPP